MSDTPKDITLPLPVQEDGCVTLAGLRQAARAYLRENPNLSNRCLVFNMVVPVNFRACVSALPNFLDPGRYKNRVGLLPQEMGRLECFRFLWTGEIEKSEGAFLVVLPTPEQESKFFMKALMDTDESKWKDEE